MSALLEIDELSVTFRAGRTDIRAVEGVSVSIEPGQRVGIIGESGSGKSVTALSVLRLHDERHTRTDGAIRFCGEDLLRSPIERIGSLRGREISMVFQDPMAALNPVFRIGDQLGHVARSRLGTPSGQLEATLVSALESVEIQAPPEQLRRYPHELSGGMRQRVLIAMAMLCEPRLLIADEPTSALDVTVQAAVLETIKRVAAQKHSAVLLITHDMGVVARFCDQVHVMYGGRIVESGAAREVFARPRHPYTAALLRCTPRVDGDRRRRLDPIPGTQPVRRGGEPLNACPFAPRCDHVRDICHKTAPATETYGDGGQSAACHRAADLDLRKETGGRDETVDLHL